MAFSKRGGGDGFGGLFIPVTVIVLGWRRLRYAWNLEGDLRNGFGGC